MTEEEIYRKILERKMTGIHYHLELSEYYKFLAVDKYWCLHKKHANCEMKDYEKTVNKYMEYTNKLIKTASPEIRRVVPDSWYGYKRQDVNPSEKRKAVRDGFQMWLDWEIETKSLYLEYYAELKQMNSLTLARMVGHMIMDEDEEISEAESMMLDLADAEYSMEKIKETDSWE